MTGQGRRWEYLAWDGLSWWDRVDKQHSLSGVIAAHSGSGSLEQDGHRAGQPSEEVSQSGQVPFIIILCPLWLLLLTPGAQPGAGHCSWSPPEPPMTQPRLSQLQTGWNGLPASSLHGISALIDCKPQRQLPKTSNPGRRHRRSPRTWVLEHTTFTHWRLFYFSVA